MIYRSATVKNAEKGSGVSMGVEIERQLEQMVKCKRRHF
jgi:hypothetical protein